MKNSSRLLSALVALMMLLSCASAFAEEAPAVPTTASALRLQEAQQGTLASNVTLALDKESIASLVAMFTGGDESMTPVVNSALELLANLSIDVIASGESASGMAQLGLNGTPFAAFEYAMQESGVALMSNLFPSYVLNIALPAEAMTASSAMVEQMASAYIAAIEGIVQSAMGEAEVGAFDMGEYGVYQSATPIKITNHQLMPMAAEIVKAMQSNPVTAQFFSGMSDIDEAVAAELAKEDYDILDGTVYANEDGQVLADAVMTIPDEGGAVKILALVTTAEDAIAAINASVIIAEQPVEDWDAYIAGFSDGTSAGGVLDFNYGIAAENDVETLNMNVQATLSGVQLGIAGQTATTLTGDFAQQETVTVSMFGLPLVTMTANTAATDAAYAFSTDDKTAVALDVTADTSDPAVQEALAPLLAELQSVGLPAVLGGMLSAMPEEVQVLMNALQSEPEPEAVPDTEIDTETETETETVPAA